MNKQIEALKMAIEALESCSMFTATNDYSDYLYESIGDAIQACKEALAHQAPKNCTPLDEYIAEMEKDPEIKQLLDIAREDVKKWSTQPSLAPSWQGLSDDDVKAIEEVLGIDKVYIRAVERTLKEKNHAS
jgi:hypothetical protein